MARPQLSTRVEESVYNQVVEIETKRQINRSDVVRELIIKGLHAEGFVPPTPSVTEAAKQLTNDQIKMKKELEMWKVEAIKWKKKAKSKNGETSGSPTPPVPIHPLITEIETSGIILHRDDEEVNITTLSSLLDFISQFKN